MSGELRSLTGVRGIAAWFVVLYHIRESVPDAPGWMLAVLAKGYLAVDFFFLLSGFVIWLAWSARLRREGVAAIGDFLRRRIARIWPLHLVMLAFGLALAILIVATGRPLPVSFPIDELPLHLFLVQNWGFTETLTWNVPAWSISAEFAAYLAFAPLAIAIDWRRVPGAGLIAVAAVLFALLHWTMRDAPDLGWWVARYGLARCLVEFTAGTITCALWLRWRDGRTAAVVASVGFGVLLLASCMAGLLPETLVVAPAFAALLLALALTDGVARNPLGTAAIHYLGRISYATYLSHFLLFYAFKFVLSDAASLGIPQVLAYLAIVLGASILLYHGIELPAQRWINGARFQWPPEPSSPPARG